MTLNLFTECPRSPYKISHKNTKSKDPVFTDETKAAGESLLSGADQFEIEDRLVSDVRGYLRWKKEQVIKGYDYATATKIDEISNSLLMRNQISSFQAEQDAQLRELKIRYEQNDEEIKDLQNNKERFLKDWETRKNDANEKLKNDRDEEIERAMEKYEKDPPSPAVKKYSPDLIILRKQELSLTKAQRYGEAQAIREEVEAIEAYENEVFKIEWLKRGMMEREKIEEKFNKQLTCLNEKYGLEMTTLTPNLKKKEEHLLFVKDNLRKQIRKLQKTREHAGKLQTRISDCNDEFQLARVKTSTNHTTYTRASKRNGRNKSSFK